MDGSSEYDQNNFTSIFRGLLNLQSYDNTFEAIKDF